MRVIVNICIDDKRTTWLHREMELAFTPTVGMEFEFKVEREGAEPHYQANAVFVVDSVTWVEKDNTVHVWLFVSKDEEFVLTVKDFSTFNWKSGEKERWQK